MVGRHIREIKLHITTEQLSDLSKEQYKKLIGKLGLNILANMRHGVSRVESISRNITIGEMISILYKYDCDVCIESAGLQWYVSVAGHIDTQAQELVDALWEAVKETL